MSLNSRRACALTGVALLCATAPSCGTDEAPSLSTGNADSGAGLALDASSCVPQSCACGGQAGMRRCDPSGQLGACECPSAPTPEFDAGVVVVTGGCPTGRYSGNFKGTAGFIIPTADISGLELFNDMPPLQITLSPSSGGSEFEVVGDGVMRGNANGAFPFEAMIKGNLDCGSRKFKATLSGSVQLFLEGIRNDFTGSMESSYDASANAFVDGTWTVMGNAADGGSDFGLTANGSWSANYAKDASADAGP